MTRAQNEIYEKTVKRLARMGVKDPTGQIVALAEEIEQYRAKIRNLEEQLQKTRHSAQKPPKPPKPRYTRYVTEMGCFVAPHSEDAFGSPIIFNFVPKPESGVTLVFGTLVDALAYYENQEADT